MLSLKSVAVLYLLLAVLCTLSGQSKDSARQPLEIAAFQIFDVGIIEVQPRQDVYYVGDVVTFIATPATGYRFIGWTNPDLGEDPVITVTLTEFFIATALFLPRPPFAVLNNLEFVPANGGSAEIRIQSADLRDWSLAYNADWLSVSLNHLDDEGTVAVVFTADFNPSAISRTAIINIEGTSVWIRQPGQKLPLQQSGPSEKLLEAQLEDYLFQPDATGTSVVQLDQRGEVVSFITRQDSFAAGTQVVHVSRPFRYVRGPQPVFVVWSDGTYSATEIHGNQQDFAKRVGVPAPFKVLGAVADSGHGQVLIACTDGSVFLINARTGAVLLTAQAPAADVAEAALSKGFFSTPTLYRTSEWELEFRAHAFTWAGDRLDLKFTVSKEGALLYSSQLFVPVAEVEGFWFFLRGLQKSPEADEWYFSPELGWVVPYDFKILESQTLSGWLWLPQIGWLWVLGSQVDGASFWSPEYGWLLTDSSIFPLAFSVEQGGVVNLLSSE